ncbi:hypothetical protein J6590_063380 [Homalodisca vitripennis]|nr:hypothetical protein J6590_063380 [Homalodisca vitripennis]
MSTYDIANNTDDYHSADRNRRLRLVAPQPRARACQTTDRELYCSCPREWLSEGPCLRNDIHPSPFIQSHRPIPSATISLTRRGPKQMVLKHPPKPLPTTNTSVMIREIIPESTSRDCE